MKLPWNPLAVKLDCETPVWSSTPMGVEDHTGVSQSSFTANGFQGSFTYQNPSGTAYFDRSTLTALKRLLGRGQRIGTVCPSYGRRP